MQSGLSALALQPEFESEELVIFVCEKQCNNSTKISSATMGLSEPAFWFHCSKWKIARRSQAGYLGVKVPSCLCFCFVHSLILTGNKRPVLHSSKQIFKYASFTFSLLCYCHFNTIWLHIWLSTIDVFTMSLCSWLLASGTLKPKFWKPFCLQQSRAELNSLFILKLSGF